jgi:hypothetical protein
MNRVPRLWRSGMLGFPLIPSPAGLGSRLASGPYGPASFGPNASAFHDPYPLLQPPRTRHALRIPIITPTARPLCLLNTLYPADSGRVWTNISIIL